MAGRNESNRSITNVAALANVSIATVSRVLSGKRTKDDDIARRVRAAAEQLNYSVNYAASALRSTITNTIGLVIPSATETFSAQLLDEIEPTIDVDSQQLLLGIGPNQAAQGERIASLVARHVDGLIVGPISPKSSNNMPVPCRSYRSEAGNVPSIHRWSASTKTPPWR